MIAKFLQSLWQDRRAATAVIIALMTVPLMITSGAAVDFSRLSSARAQLQYAVDSASLAGVGAYQVNKDGTVAYNVAKTAFGTSSTNVDDYAVVTGTVATVCNPGGVANVTCGTTSPSNGTATTCPSTTIYCVQVSAHATLQNSLLAFVIPSDALNVSAFAQSTGTNSLTPGSFSHTGVGYGSDLDAIYAYAVPQDGAGNPEYNNIPSPNSYCANSSYGPIRFEPTVPAANGVSSCNFVLIGENTAGSGSGTIAFQQDDPIGFYYTNFYGENIGNSNAASIGDLDTTVFNTQTGASTANTSTNQPTPAHYANELYVTTPVPGSTSGATTTTYYPTGLSVKGTALYSTCPAHNLYGSINVYPTPAADIVPYQDSISNYASDWELLGYPPTHATNHYLLPFLGPKTSTTLNKTDYTVQAVCPQWPTTGTNISATASFSPSDLPPGYSPVSNAPAGYPTENVQVYATYYPDVPYTVAGDIFPPVIAACTPATSAGDRGVTPTSDDPWWGWSPPNASQPDPGGAGENPGGGAVTNCTSTKLNSGATAITATQDAIQTSTYDDCTFLIQPLGTSVPTTNGVPDLPDYYTYLESPTAFASQQTGNPSGIISSLTPLPTSSITLTLLQANPTYGMMPVYDGVTGSLAVGQGNTRGAGYVPGSVSIAGTSPGPYTVTEPPGNGTDHYPPEDTSHQCYNPQANGLSSTALPGTDQPNNDTGGPIDPVANPEFGAVYCNSNPPPSFVLMWNDMGTYAYPPRYNDDLGYANAITEFTCPTSGNPGTSGPPALGG